MTTSFIRSLLAFVLIVTACVTQAQPRKITGQQLAANLRLSQPAENNHFSAKLNIKRPKQKPFSIDVTTQIAVKSNSWESIYTATAKEEE